MWQPVVQGILLLIVVLGAAAAVFDALRFKKRITNTFPIHPKDSLSPEQQDHLKTLIRDDEKQQQRRLSRYMAKADALVRTDQYGSLHPLSLVSLEDMIEGQLRKISLLKYLQRSVELNQVGYKESTILEYYFVHNSKIIIYGEEPAEERIRGEVIQIPEEGWVEIRSGIRFFT
ncbi:hypothetical protein [Paenibacillus hubeiensis]|uniref:hypothetical protein n=1 Tax=Paenibacillus hubeiensis TaxID=3077330 RepID=UPI0031BBB346